MKESIGRIYLRTQNAALVRAAVIKGWITAADYKSITGQEYAA